MTLVRDHPDGVHPLSHDEHGNPVVKLTPRGMHTSVVLVDKLDRAVLRAVAYALTLGATEVRAVHAAVDPDRAMHLADAWMASGVPIALDVVECWDRNVPRTLEEEVIQLGRRGDEVTVVMPRRDFPKLRQRLLHDRHESTDRPPAGAPSARRRGGGAVLLRPQDEGSATAVGPLERRIGWPTCA